jgi:hypothetical protein
MGGRNLHIVDVLDVDSKGQDKRSFGRVFYTQEKSLIFYAFDLGDRATSGGTRRSRFGGRAGLLRIQPKAWESSTWTIKSRIAGC